jgi:hypothetical protein
MPTKSTTAAKRSSSSANAAPGNARTVPNEVERAMAERARLGSTCNWIFEVDYSINSKYPRFFVYNIRDTELLAYKCAHGGGGRNRQPHDGVTREVSNVPGSHCSSLGVILTGEHYDSEKVGDAVRLNGMSPTNSNISRRGVVLHGGQYVSDSAQGTDTTICGRSEGCIVVDDRYIDYYNGGELIDWLKDGSVGVTHYDGRFEI